MLEFIPSKPQKTVITLRIENEQLSKIDTLSAKSDISRNEFIIQCIEFALKHYSNMSDEA